MTQQAEHDPDFLHGPDDTAWSELLSSAGLGDVRPWVIAKPAEGMSAQRHKRALNRWRPLPDRQARAHDGLPANQDMNH
jgi:hypothetical protein